MLDESAAWNQKQVIIPNYLQSASNCAVSTKHYQLCCPNLCEGILADSNAFPPDCAFPHKVGTVVTSGVEEFYGYAEEEEMAAIAVSFRHNISEPLVNDTSEWMSLWSSLKR